MSPLRIGMVIIIVNRWMKEHCLSLSLSTTVIVVQTIIPMRVAELEILTKSAVKYLVLAVDSKNTFGEMQNTAEKPARGVASFSWSRLLTYSVNSFVLNGVGVWYLTLFKNRY